MIEPPSRPAACRHHLRLPAAARRAVGLVVVLALCLSSRPGAAETWRQFVTSLGPPGPPDAVLDYLKHDQLVLSTPKPKFSTIRTETVDGTVAQSFRLTGFDGGFGHVEGMREERTEGNRRSGAQAVSMVTALAGLVLVSFDNKTTGASVYLRKIELSGALLPPRAGRTLAMRYERVQRAADVVVEEVQDCTLEWTEPDAAAPLLESRCTGSTRITQPTADGNTKAATSPANATQTFVFRPDLGWIFNQQTRVLETTP